MKIKPMAALRLVAIKCKNESFAKVAVLFFLNKRIVGSDNENGVYSFISYIPIFFYFSARNLSMKYNRLPLLILLIFSTNLFAQTIFLRSGDVQPRANIRKEVVDSFNRAAKLVAGQAFAVIQFNHIPSAEERKLLAANGIELLDYLPENSFTVSVKGKLSLLALQKINAA
ncbi:MAG: hypothetical protein M3Y85_09625, partial [Bacteroidota bacterium]|nr:hypothetical protein [Bacteroidota bacterium]